MRKKKKATEGHFVVMDSEKVILNKALDEAKATHDKAIAMVDSLKIEQKKAHLSG